MEKKARSVSTDRADQIRRWAKRATVVAPVPRLVDMYWMGFEGETELRLRRVHSGGRRLLEMMQRSQRR